MSNLPSAETSPGGNGPPLPPGWLANWSPEHNAWYYVFPATGITQWAFPTFPPVQQQYEAVQGPDTHATTDRPNNTEVGEVGQPPEEGDRGLGKASLALGGSFLAGCGGIILCA